MEEHPQALDLDSKESLNLDGLLMVMSSNKVESLKRMGKFIVTVCVFSLVLALFFSLFSFFPHSFSFYFSSFLFSDLLNHAIQRKYMFLLCNGILFFLANCSVDDQDNNNNSPSGTSLISHSDDQFDHQHHYDLVAAIDGSTSEEEDQNQEMKLEEEVEENGGFEEEEDEDEDEEEEGKGSELEVVVSTEELNKKIEEFIRRMKEEMRIEAAQTQLIAV